MANRPSLIESKGGRSSAARERPGVMTRRCPRPGARPRTCLEDGDSRAGWSSPIVWGDRVFVTSVVSTARSKRRRRDSTSAATGPAPTIEHRWMVLPRLRDRQDRLGARGASRRAAAAASPQEHATPRRRRSPTASASTPTSATSACSLRPRRQAGVAKQIDADADAQRLGHRRLAGAPRRPPLFRQRQREKSFLSRSTRRPARRCGASSARRRATGPRRSSGRTTAHRDRHAGTSSVRSYDLDGKLLWELGGMSTHHDPDAVRGARPALRQLGLRRRLRWPGVRDQARGGGRHLASRARSATHSSPGPNRRRAPTTRRRSSTATLYTLLDRGFFTCHDAKTGKEIYTSSGSTDGQRRSPRRRGPTTARSSSSARTATPRDPGRAGVQGDRQELARRDVHGDTGDPSRQLDHPHRRRRLYRIAETK